MKVFEPLPPALADNKACAVVKQQHGQQTLEKSLHSALDSQVEVPRPLSPRLRFCSCCLHNFPLNAKHLFASPGFPAPTPDPRRLHPPAVGCSTRTLPPVCRSTTPACPLRNDPVLTTYIVVRYLTGASRRITEGRPAKLLKDGKCQARKTSQLPFCRPAPRRSQYRPWR